VPLHWDFDATNKIIRFRLEGRIGDREIEDCYREMGAVSGAVEAKAGVADFSAVTSFEVSRQTIVNLAKQEPALPGEQRPRVLIATSPYVLGILRMFQMEGESTRPNLYVVQTHEAAWAILGIKEPAFAAYNGK